MTVIPTYWRDGKWWMLADEVKGEFDFRADVHDEVRADRDRLLEALQKYGEHRPGCKAWFGVQADVPNDETCTCGFTEHATSDAEEPADASK